ncbi:hypothetical protein EVAR_80638_1 [Eumeta japonica]|uniref:Uncharacterized protein n=1 Tax=Eumeta variegata TaxID=151549 RepID=A0A4C1YR56_EUMVA|nr:hypothetical protein EVAR_80638_1 [Eumeta japonica]
MSMVFSDDPTESGHVELAWRLAAVIGTYWPSGPVVRVARLSHLADRRAIVPPRRVSVLICVLITTLTPPGGATLRLFS